MSKVEADYVPRRCEATNRVIAANDHASVLIPIAEVDSSGIVTGKTQTLSIGGGIRKGGQSDAALNRILGERGLISFKK